MDKKDKIIFLLAGILGGLLVTSVGGIVLYKVAKASDFDWKESLGGLKSVFTEKFSKSPKSRRVGTIFSTTEGQLVKAASSLNKFFQDGQALVGAEFSDSVVLSAAKNEYESFQILVKSGPEKMSSVVLQMSDLINPATNATIPIANASWRQVGFVPTKKPYYPVKYVGLWPDPLIMVDAVDIEPNTTQPLWITVYVPPDVAAGKYTSAIRVLAGGKEIKSIPVELTVYDFVLPKENSLKTAFDFYPHVTRDRYFRRENESSDAYQARIGVLNEQFTIEMLKFRMNLILNIDPQSQAALGRIDRYRVFGLNNFAIGRYGGTFNNNWPDTKEAVEKLMELYRTYGEVLKLNKMLEMTYIYTWDEGPMGNPRVSTIASMIHRAYPGLKNMVCYHGIFDPDENPEWIKDIDIWTFQIDNFDEAKYNKLKKAGKEMWMYISGPGGMGSPNLAIDFDAMDPRITPWVCWKYDLKGFLYWCTNWWTVDPFKSAANTKWEQNGNGLLFYPGQRGPVASLRAELWRDGVEDYEYLTMLKNKIQHMDENGLSAANPQVRKEALKLLTVEGPLVTSMFEFSKDGKLLQERRNAIAAMIGKINKILTP